MLVKDLMATPVINVSNQTTVGEALELIKKHDVRHLPVVDPNGQLLGVTSEADLLRVFPKYKENNQFEYNLISRTPVNRIMVATPVTINPYATIEEAALVIKEHKIGCLPVVENNKIIGLISRTDVIDAFINSMGLGKAGLRLTISYEKKFGFLSDLIMKADKLGAIIDHFVTFDHEIVLKIQPEQAEKFVKDLKESGYKINDVTCIEKSTSKPCA